MKVIYLLILLLSIGAFSAVNDPQYSNGSIIIYQSTGSTVTINYANGSILVSHDATGAAVSACTLFVVAQTGGTVRQASVADSTNHLLKDTADAAAGYRWAYWKARQLKVLKWTPDSVTAAVACSLSGNDTIFAYFSRVQYPLTNTNDGHGTFTPATGAQDSGTAFDIVSTAGVGYRFWKWTRSGVNVVITDSSLASTSAYLKAAGTITLNDTIVHYLMTNANDGHGAYTPATALHDSGAVFAIAATPAAHYAFTSWSVSGGAHVTSSTTASTTAWMTEPGTVTANFHSIQHTLTIAVSGPGTTTPPPGDVLLDTAIRQTIHGTPTSAWDTLAHWTGTTGVHFNPDSSACSLSASGTATCVFGMRAATTPTQISPAQGDTLKSKAKVFTWSAQATTDSAFILGLSTDSTTFVFDTVTTNSKGKTLSDSTKYFWKVKGGNPGGWSAYSTVLRFRTLTAVGAGRRGRGSWSFGLGFQSCWHRVWR